MNAMSSIELVLVLLACFGMTLILVHGKILDCPRNFLVERFGFFGKMIQCSMCTGWWVGLFFAFIWVLHGTFPYLFYFITLAFASSGVSFLLERMAIFIDDNVEEPIVHNTVKYDEDDMVIEE